MEICIQENCEILCIFWEQGNKLVDCKAVEYIIGTLVAIRETKGQNVNIAQ